MEPVLTTICHVKLIYFRYNLIEYIQCGRYKNKIFWITDARI